MLMSDKLPQEILKCFDKFFILWEKTDFPTNTITQRSTDSAFQLACYIEKTTKTLNDEQYTSFENVLRSQLLEESNKSIHFMKADINNACDRVLEKYLTNPNLKSEIVNMGITSYIKLCGRERFQEVLSKNILLGESYQTTQCFIEDNLQNLIPLELHSELLILKYLQLLKKGHTEEVKESINKIFEDFNEENINILLNILLSQYQTELDAKELNTFILMSLMSKTNDSENTIWGILFKDINRLISLCLKYPRVLLQVGHFFVLYKEKAIAEQKGNQLPIKIINNALQILTEDIRINNKINLLFCNSDHKYINDLHAITDYKKQL